MKFQAVVYIWVPINVRTSLAWGSVVVKALRYKSVGPGIDSKR